MPHEQNQLRSSSANITDIWMKSTFALWDLQAETTRRFLELQARNAAIFGAPDLSEAFKGNDETSRMFSNHAERMKEVTRKASEVQDKWRQTFVDQTSVARDNFRTGLEEISRTSSKGLDELNQMASRAQDEVQQLQQAAQQTRKAGQSQEPQMGSTSIYQGEAKGGQPKSGGK